MRRPDQSFAGATCFAAGDGEIPAGAVPGDEVSSGKAARVFTGSPLPEGADAVIMQEDTRAEGVQVLCSTASGRWKIFGFAVRISGKELSC